MTQVLILHHSRTGITAAYAETIAATLSEQGVATRVLPLYQASKISIDDYDTLFIGCWTSGLMVLGQHPEKSWVSGIQQLPALAGKQIILFTTYKILTGSMFRKMKQHLPADASVNSIVFKSRNGQLNSSDRAVLKQLIGH